MKCKLCLVCFAIFFLCTILIACAYPSTHISDNAFVELFSIPIGMSEHMLFYTDHPSAIPFNKSAIDTQGGVFTVFSGLINKINRYTSYGELIFSLYDPSRSGVSAISLLSDQQESISSRFSRTYSFNGINNIAVNTQGVFYIADDVHESQVVYDEDIGSTLRMRIVRYDSRNDHFSVIGQEGIGGTSFPPIIDISVVNENELVVVCNADDAWLVFWYSHEGRLLYQVAFPPTAIPALLVQTGAAEIRAIVPDVNKPRLYINVNYYNQQNGVISRIYWLDLPEGLYQDFAELPRYEQDDGFLQQPIASFLGATNSNQLVFYSFVSDNSLEITVLDLDSTVLLRRTVTLGDELILFSRFSLSSDGIISALLGHEYRARVLWWRMDKELSRLK